MPNAAAEGVNVGDTERALTLTLGGILIVRALARPSAWSWPLALMAGVLGYRALRGQCPLYRALGLRTAAESGVGAGPTTSPEALVVEKSASIRRPRDEVYRFWRALENLPRFMTHLRAVRMAPDGTSHWTVKGPAGTTFEWDADITADTPGELIA